MKNTSLISGCGALDVMSSSYRASDEHPMSTRSASDGGRWNSRGWKYVACMLIAFFVGVGQMWGQAIYDMESGSAWGGSNTSNRALNAEAKRTGSQGLYATGSNGNGRRVNSPANDVEANTKYYAICWVRTSENATAGIGIGGAASSYPFECVKDTWRSIYVEYTQGGKASTKTVCPTFTFTKNTTLYVDDVVFYATTADGPDLSYPNGPTAGVSTTTAINWTNRDDSGDGATGRQATLIWKRTGGAANDLTLNNQGNYVVPAEGSTLDQSGHWTLVNAFVADDATSYEGTFTPGDVYAIVHRDLAYNYSNPAYVTITGGSGGGCTNVGIGTQPTSPVAATVGVASSITGLVASGTNPTYQWQTCNSDGTGAADISAAGAMSFTGYTTATLGLTPTAEGATYYKCVVSGDCGDPVTSNVVTVNASPTYTVTYNDNGKTGGGAAPSDATAYASGAEVTVKGNPNDMTKTHCVFMGWNTKADGTGTIYMEGEKFNMPSENTTLYAMWGVKLSWVVQVNVAETAVTTTSTASSYTTSVAAPSNLALTDLTVTSSSKTTATNKISTTKAKGGYISATFEVQDGYEFTPTHMVLKTTAISEAITVDVNVGDEVQTWAQPKSGADPDLHIYKFADPEAITGSGTMKIYAYGGSDGTKGYRLGTPIEIYGFVAEAAAPDPSTKRIYLKCGSTWCDDVADGAPKFFVHSWGSVLNDAAMTLADCETDVYYADIPASNTSLIFTRQKAASTERVWSGDNFVNQSVDITIGDNDLFTCTGWSDGLATFSGSTYAAPSYTISFNNGGGTGSMSSISSLACGAEQAVTANSFTKAGYAFANWTADVAVTVGGGTVSAGSAIAGGATIQNITSDITLTAQWTQEVPTSVSVDGTWRCFPGQTISLTATPTGGTSDFTYQWQKYVTSAWQDIDGANEATYSKANCTVSDCGSYRCVVSKAGGSVASDGYDVHIYTLNGNYNGSDWISNDLTLVSGTVGKVELSLEAGRLYKFKVKDNFANYWFGNAGYMLKSETGWTCPNNESGDIRVFTGAAGTYTFTVDIANVNYGTPEVAVSVTYPSVTHPVAGYIYYTKGDITWENVAVHWWNWENETATDFIAWANNPWLTEEQSVTICGTKYYYMPKFEGYNRVIFHNAGGEGQTSDITVDASSSGKYISGNSTEWTAFPSYTVTFNSNGGSEVASQNVACGGTATAPNPAPTRLNYDFEGWQLNGVNYNFATVVSDNITLDAVWTRKAVDGEESDVVLVSTSAAIGSTSPLTDVYYGNNGEYTGSAAISTGGSMFGTPMPAKKWVGFTIPANYTATVTANATNSNERHCVLVTEAERAGAAGDATFLFDITVNSSTTTATSASVEPGAYCVGSTSGGISINSVIVHLTYLPTVKLKVNGVVTQTISISVGEKLGDIFASGTLPIVDLTGYTFNGWKNEVGDAAVDNNTVISGSMVIYADLTAHEYSVALENGETDGAATVHYGETALNITTAVSGEEGDELDGFYTAATEGTKVADADGTLVASITGYTDENGKWIKTSDATLYTIWIPYVPSSDATLSDLTIGGETVDGFDAATISYDVELPFGTTVAPTIAGTANDAKAKSVVVTQAASANGDATVVVTAEDNSTKTYTIHFSVVATKDIELVWATDKQRCDATTPSAKALIATASTYLSASYTGSAAEGGSLTTNKTTGSKIIITAQPGYAFKAMGFYGKIEDGTCNFYNDGVVETIGTSTGDACYSDVFSNDEVHEFVFELTGTNGIYIRNMQLTMIQACTPKTIAWTTEPAAEYELGSSPAAIAASANNGTVTYASNDDDVIAVNESTGALTLKTLGTMTLSASVPAGDGVTYCDEGAQISKANIATYYLVTFNAQNGTPVSTTKYYKNDAAIALPEDPSFAGYVFQGWFDAAEGGNAVTSAITPTASRTIYAHWEAQCEGPMITTQSGSRSYFVGREAATLVGVASAANEGALTYTWYSCDDAERTNPVALAGAPTPSTAAAGTQYYYFTVTEAGCDVVATSDVIVITVTEKDKARIIKATLKGGTTTPDVEGYLAGSATASTYSYNSTYDGYKLGSNGNYISLTLADDEEFKTGDVVNIYVGGVEGDPASKAYFATAANNDAVVATIVQNLNQGNNYINLPAALNGEQTFYLYRLDSKMNPYVKYVEVYRAYPVPVLTAMTINGSAATINGTNVTATIASNAELASLDIVPTFMSNDPTQTNGALGDWSEVSEGVYTASYVVTDKDEDTNTYLITLTRDVEITSITISGETSVAEESQITLTATVLPNNVINKAVVWSSSDETKAEVDENGVVTAKAAGAVTITATSVVDNTKYGTYDITVTGYIGTKRAYWFAYADDAAANSVSNNSTVFGSAPTGSNSGARTITLEEGWVVNTTKYAGSPGSTGTFVVPAEYTATFYAAAKASGSSGRYIQLKQGDVVKYTSNEFEGSDPQVVKIEDVAAGTYTITYVNGMSNFYLYAAELSRYAITSVTLESDFTLRTEDSRTPDMTIVHAKAAIASQTWSILSSTATGTTINESTGEITAGTTPGTITVQVEVTDAMSNVVTSNICTVEIVEEFERIDVTGSMTWNWNELSMSAVNVSADRGLALANYIEGEKWQMLNGTNGDYAYRNEASGCYEAMNGSSSLSFHTTVPGMVKITGRRRSNDAVVKINGDITVGTVTSSVQTFDPICVAPGEVAITPDANGMRITKLEFIALSEFDPAEAEESKLGGNERAVNPQYYGTICLPKAGVMTGAMLFQVAYMDYKEDGTTPYKVYYDQVENGVMQAGMPYIFLAEQSTIGVYYTGITEVTAGNELNYHGLHGTLTDINEGMNATGIYMLYNNQVLHSTNPASSLPANRAYLQISEIPGYNNPGYIPAAPKYRRISTGFNGVNTATGMDEITNYQSPITNKVLIDGQIFIIRGEKMYDVTGKLVK